MPRSLYLILLAGLLAGCGSIWHVSNMDSREIRSVTNRQLCGAYNGGALQGALGNTRTPAVRNEVARRGVICGSQTVGFYPEGTAPAPAAAPVLTHTTTDVLYRGSGAEQAVEWYFYE